MFTASKPILLVLAFLVALSICAQGYSNTDNPAFTLAKAEDILIRENVIAERDFVNSFGVNKPTEQSWAFSTICKLAVKPEDVFVRLVKAGSYYGLIGLRKYNLASFREALKEFRGEPLVYILSHDSFVVEEATEFADRITKDEKGVHFECLIWSKIPEWTETVRVRHPGKNP